ncbi:MAG: hypothetical protein QG579_265 [Patescibacteria group bacterium]|nr:hypothetical protein [Patescibacteria group bacterium]
MVVLTAILWICVFVALVYFAPILDANVKNWFFEKGPGPDKFSVLVTSQGERVKKYVANGVNSSYNTLSGLREKGADEEWLKKQSPIFKNVYCQHYFNAWGLVYKPLSQKLWECPWLDGATEIPLAESKLQETPECEIAGLPHDMKTRLTFEQKDLSMFFYLGEQSSTDVILSDYDGALRSFTHAKGKSSKPGETVDTRTIYGTKTEEKEGSPMDPIFKEFVYSQTNDNAEKYGRALVNIAITSVKPAASVGALLQEETEAEVKARAREKAAKGQAAEILALGEAEAAVIERKGEAAAKAEKRLRDAGVTDSARQSIAIEKTSLGSLALVPVSPTHETGNTAKKP